MTNLSFPKQIAFLLQLKTLNLNDNHLTCIPEEISLLRQLKSLCLCKNKISDLPPWLTNANNSQLQTLCIADNRFTSFPFVENLSNLKKKFIIMEIQLMEILLFFQIIASIVVLK